LGRLRGSIRAQCKNCVPTNWRLLAQWRIQRDELQAQLDSDDDMEPMSFDADAIIAELDELEEHLTGDSSSLAKDAFQRVFESITLYWERVSPALCKNCAPAFWRFDGW
jgi:hypothetical protein